MGSVAAAVQVQMGTVGCSASKSLKEVHGQRNDTSKEWLFDGFCFTNSFTSKAKLGPRPMKILRRRMLMMDSKKLKPSPNRREN